jgi:hypothetical protein
MQSGRQMTASNKVIQGMANSRDSAILAAAAEAVTWKHALELSEGPRKGQRVVIYPKDLPQLEQVLSTGDPTIDSEDGHPIAYSVILQAVQAYESPPIFVKEDSEQITGNPEIADKVPCWMNMGSVEPTRQPTPLTSPANSDEEEMSEDQKRMVAKAKKMA